MLLSMIYMWAVSVVQLTFLVQLSFTPMKTKLAFYRLMLGRVHPLLSGASVCPIFESSMNTF